MLGKEDREVVWKKRSREEEGSKDRDEKRRIDRKMGGYKARGREEAENSSGENENGEMGGENNRKAGGRNIRKEGGKEIKKKIREIRRRRRVD